MKIIFDVEDVLGEAFDSKFVKQGGFSSRTEALRHLMRQSIEDQNNASFHEAVTQDA